MDGSGRSRARLTAASCRVFVARQVPTRLRKMAFAGKVGRDRGGIPGGQSLNARCPEHPASRSRPPHDGAQPVRLTGFVCSSESFTDQPTGINGASELVGQRWETAGCLAARGGRAGPGPGGGARGYCSGGLKTRLTGERQRAQLRGPAPSRFRRRSPPAAPRGSRAGAAVPPHP